MRDKAGNAHRGPVVADPRRRRRARPRTGVDGAPADAVGAVGARVGGRRWRGSRVGPTARRFRFALSRLGSHRGAAPGHAPRRPPCGCACPTTRTRVSTSCGCAPVGDAPSGLSVVNGQAAGGRRPCSRPRPLVILPVITWQGVNAVRLGRRRFRRHARRRRSVPAERPLRRAAGSRRAARARGLAAPELPRPRAPVATTSPRTCRWPGERVRRWATPRGWPSPARPSGCRGASATRCSPRSTRTG